MAHLPYTAKPTSVKNQSDNLSSQTTANESSQNGPGWLYPDGGCRRSGREKFNVDASTGGLTMAVPISTTPGRSGFGPSLELSYSSGSTSTNSTFGQGWQLTGVDRISRKTSTMIPTYDDDVDIFVHSSLGDLVPALQDDTGEVLEREADSAGLRYRVRKYYPRVHSEPVRIERWHCLNAEGAVHWRVVAQGSVVTVFGADSSSRISRCSDHGKTQCFAWLASESYDVNGNLMKFTYKPETQDVHTASVPAYERNRHLSATTAQRYLKSIHYGNRVPNRDMKTWDVIPVSEKAAAWMFTVVFDYGEHTAVPPTTHEDSPWELRPDPFSIHKSGFEIRTYRRCRRVMQFHHFGELPVIDCLVGTTDLQYVPNKASGVSQLQSYWTSAYRWTKDGIKPSCLTMPPTTFEYWDAPDVGTTPVEELELPLSGFSSTDAKWIDLHGDGAPGALSESRGRAWYYCQNDSGEEPSLRPPEAVPRIPSTADVAGYSFDDFTGDGRADITFMSSDGQLRGFYETVDGDDWVHFVPLESHPSAMSFTDPMLRKIDLTGDGQTDLLWMASQPGEELAWYSSLGRRGYGPERRTQNAPELPLDDSQSAVLLCDMSGDGLSDIVLVRNGHICYWPNLGHGCFGTKVLMGNPPTLEDGLNPQRLRTADVTGSGTTDLIYLPPRGGVHVFYNHSGNYWSDAYTWPAFPALDQKCAVDVLDIGGRGTPCLCWTTDRQPGASTLRFLDLMGGNQSGQLVGYTNGTGGEVKIGYRSSTRYHRDSRRDGRPWTTSLPFPVSCVSSITSKDQVSRTVSTCRYKYHNGYYDPLERQFRGFQMVEQRKTVGFTVGSSSSCSQEPVLTRSWFYVGLDQLDEPAVLPGSWTHPQHAHTREACTDIHARSANRGLTTHELHQAYRSLAGRFRREEVFSYNTSGVGAVPHQIRHQTYSVGMQQGAESATPHAVFRVSDREALTWHCDPRGGEPRLQHTLVLERNDFGDVCKQATVHYGKPNSSIQGEDGGRQKDTVILYQETDHTNSIDPFVSINPDYFQAPLPSEVRHYHVVPGPSWPGSSQYTWSTLTKALEGAADAGVYDPITHVVPSASTIGNKMLISREQKLYTAPTDLSAPLPLRHVEPLSKEYQSYKMAATTELLQKALGLDSESLCEMLRSGSYALKGTEVWVPSSRMLFLGDDDKGHGSLETARAHFNIPNAQIDPYGNVSRWELDANHLLLVSRTDSLGNRSTLQNDYSCLKPVLVTDANGNRTQTCLDAWGRPVGVAAMGKETESIGDSLAGFSVELGSQQLVKFFNDPSGPILKSLLGEASTRTIYCDHCEWDQNGNIVVPAFRAELVRDTHCSSAEDSQIAVQISYLDGNKDVIQKVSLNSSNGDKWRVDGWAIHDQKRQVMQQYLPFMNATHKLSPPSDHSPATTFIRDALDRVVATVNPDRTWSKTRFTPWSQVHFDAGDTVGIKDPADDEDFGVLFARITRSSYFPTWSGDDKTPSQALSKSAVYSNTPTIMHTDALGRPIATELDNGPSDTGLDKRMTSTRYDVQGNVIEVRDALQRVVSRTRYDLLGRSLHSMSMDRCDRWYLSDSGGDSFLSWTSQGDRKRLVYDKLRRVETVNFQPQNRGSSSEVVLIKNIYGDHQPDAAQHNLKGQLYQCYDQSGLQTSHRFDFHGNLLESSIRYAVDYKNLLDWSLESTRLEDEEYKIYTSFNAIGRVTSAEDFTGEVVSRTYDVAGRLCALQSLAADGKTVTSAVRKIEYADDDQIMLIEYGNGSRTTNHYDSTTRRLLESYTIRVRDGTKLRHLCYTHDCLGRVIHKIDKAQQSEFFYNNVIAPVSEFSYDALGQLLEATGREQVDMSHGGEQRLRPHSMNSRKHGSLPGDGLHMVGYVETYRYDPAGNIRTLQHASQTSHHAGWTRTYAYDEPSCIEDGVKGNRLSSTVVGNATEKYSYDGIAGRNGCMTGMPGFSTLDWDQNDRLRAFSTQKVADGSTPETTWYAYNSSGQRVRKVTEFGSRESHASKLKKVKETLFLPLHDVYTRYQGSEGSGITTTTAKIQGPDLPSSATILVERTREAQQDTPVLVRYNVGENLELDDSGQVLSYEEFSPYGASTCQSRTTKTPRKYRYASYHRDSESGLDHCGERYYASWLGRWTSADPLGLVDGPNVYAYAGNDPINCSDPSGTVKKPKKKSANKSGTSSADQDGAGPSGQAQAEAPQGEEMRESRYPLAEAVQSLGYEQLRSSTDLKLNFKKFLGNEEKKTTDKDKWIVGLIGYSPTKPVAVPKEHKSRDPKGFYWKIRLDYDPDKGRHVNSQFGKGDNARKIAFQNSTNLPQDPPEISTSHLERLVGRLDKPKEAEDIHNYEFEKVFSASLGQPDGLPKDSNDRAGLEQNLTEAVRRWFLSLIDYKRTYNEYMQERMQKQGLTFRSYQDF